jgi:hypothetical protein
MNTVLKTEIQSVRSINTETTEQILQCETHAKNHERSQKYRHCLWELAGNISFFCKDRQERFAYSIK